VDILVLDFDPNRKLNTLADPKSLPDVLKKADLIFVLLKARFQTHVKRKVKPCQQSNRCLLWARKKSATSITKNETKTFVYKVNVEPVRVGLANISELTLREHHLIETMTTLVFITHFHQN
jgi:hypothetical protein